MSKIFLFVLVALQVGILRHSQTQAAPLEITTQSNIASPNNIMEFKVEGNNSEKIRIKPVVSSGNVEVKNGERWVSASKLWGEMPLLETEIKIRLIDPPGQKVILSFLIQDTFRGKVYASSKTEIWPHQISEGYIQKINQSIKEWRNNDKMTP
jgi:hypothetical protein